MSPHSALGNMKALGRSIWDFIMLGHTLDKLAYVSLFCVDYNIFCCYVLTLLNIS